MSGWGYVAGLLVVIALILCAAAYSLEGEITWLAFQQLLDLLAGGG